MSPTRLVREGLVLALRQQDGLRVLDGLDLSDEAVARLGVLRPDVIVVDVTADEGMEVPRRVLPVCATPRLVAFALAEVDEAVFACAAAGFSGYAPRDSSADELAEAVRDLMCGRLRCAPHITAALFSRVGGLAQPAAPIPPLPAEPILPQLTSREREILALAETGRSNKEIARELGISGATVKNHIHNVLQKLNVARRGQAACLLRTGRP